MTTPTRRWAPAVIAVSSVFAIAGCGGSSTSESATPSAEVAESASVTSTPASAAAGDCDVTVSDAWVKAAESGMTGEFGVLTNNGETDATIVSGTSPAAAVVELHEVADGVMKETDGGFVVPAGGSLTMEPGGYHVMLMQLTGSIAAGDEVTTVLECADGGSVEILATAKEFAGGNEDYEGDGMGGMDDAGEMPSMEASESSSS